MTALPIVLWAAGGRREDLPCDSRSGDLLYNIISQRHEKRATVITTHLSFKQWGTVFPGAACVAAPVDRFVQHCHCWTSTRTPGGRSTRAMTRSSRHLRPPGASAPNPLECPAPVKPPPPVAPTTGGFVVLGEEAQPTRPSNSVGSSLPSTVTSGAADVTRHHQLDFGKTIPKCQPSSPQIRHCC
jgi:hypothetical protein